MRHQSWDGPLYHLSSHRFKHFFNIINPKLCMSLCTISILNLKVRVWCHTSGTQGLLLSLLQGIYEMPGMKPSSIPLTACKANTLSLCFELWLHIFKFFITLLTTFFTKWFIIQFILRFYFPASTQHQPSFPLLLSPLPLQ